MEHTHKTGRGGTTAAQDKTFSYLITGLAKSTGFKWTNISDFRKLQGAHSCALLKSTLENRGGGAGTRSTRWACCPTRATPSTGN
jgi:hypothetical protein